MQGQGCRPCWRGSASDIHAQPVRDQCACTPQLTPGHASSPAACAGNGGTNAAVAILDIATYLSLSKLLGISRRLRCVIHMYRQSTTQLALAKESPTVIQKLYHFRITWGTLRSATRGFESNRPSTSLMKGKHVRQLSRSCELGRLRRISHPTLEQFALPSNESS